MKTNTFNYNPSNIDRSKNFPVLCMRSGIHRYVHDGKVYKGDPSKDIAPDGYIVFDNVGWHMIFDTVKTDEYISFTRYYVQGATYSLSSFKDEIINNRPIFNPHGISRWRSLPQSMENLRQWMTFRLYPDNSIVTILTFVDENGNARSFQYMLNKMLNSDWDTCLDCCMNKLGLTLTPEEQENEYRYRRRNANILTQEQIDASIVEIWSDDDITHEFLNKKTAKMAYNWLIASGMAASFLYTGGNIIDDNVVYERCHLPKEWLEFFPDLTGDRLKEAIRMAAYDFNDHRIDVDRGIDTLFISILLANVGIKTAFLNRKKQNAETNADLWDKFYDHNLGKGHFSFSRKEDYVVICCESADSWYGDHSTMMLLNTKTKKRKILSRYTSDNIKNVPLTENAISNLIYSMRNCKEVTIRKTETAKSLMDIIAGTTAAWMLNAFESDTLPQSNDALSAWLEQTQEWDTLSRQYTYKGQTVLEWLRLSGDKSTSSDERDWPALPEAGIVFKRYIPWCVTLAKLICKDNLLLEQLAKCGMWYLFSWLMLNAEDFSSIQNVGAKDGTAALSYNPKGSSLPTILGLRMNQIRVLNEAIGSNTTKNKPIRVSLNTAKRVFNLTDKEIKSLDDHTFKRIIACSLPTKEDGYHYNRSSLVEHLNARYGNQEVKNLFNSFDTLARKLAFIEKYLCSSSKNASNVLDSFGDYLQMRAQLKRILETGARIHEEDRIELESFERDWPALPEAGTVFKRYVPGVRIEARRWGNDDAPTTEHEFQDEIKRRYPAETITWARDENNQLLGAVLKLSAADRIVYLHDDLSIWLDTKQNAHNLERFHDAYKIAKKMEYLSENFGLRIIAPQTPQDLKIEGAVLHHCVGSYVDSVCQGREKILFIRRNDMPNEPYFTMDVMPDGTIRQVHCDCNGDPTSEGIKQAYARSKRAVYDTDKDILGFLQEWATKTTGVKASSIQKHFGCLCALHA